MIKWGITALNHGSSLSVFSNNNLIMFEKFKEDRIPRSGFSRAFDRCGGPNQIYWYENPWLKKIRQIRSGQWPRVFDGNDLPSVYLKNENLSYAKLFYTFHHASHAAAGYYTSPFDHCTIVVLDAIGEFECATIWEGRNGQMKKLWSRSYPNSLGLFYSAFTKLVGLTPVQDEYLLENLSSFGNRFRFTSMIEKKHFSGIVKLKTNFHKGVNDWPVVSESIKADIAAAVQKVFENQVNEVMELAKKISFSNNLVYMGGCAMNKKYNKQFLNNYWDKVWSLPDPGDGSSSIGAVLYHTKQKIKYDFGTVNHLTICV